MCSSYKVVAILLRHNCVHWIRHERSEYSVSTAVAAASARREYCYGCSFNQEKPCVLLGCAMGAAIVAMSARRESVFC